MALAEANPDQGPRGKTAHRGAIPFPAVIRAAGARNNFKWVDNAQHPGEIIDFYVSGDVAPEGRFTFRYTAK